MVDLTLYQFPGGFGLRSLSPFCTKLEAYLRLAGVAYRAEIGDPRQAPIGKLPYVRWDGALIGDSQRIIERLKAEVGDPLDADLDPEQHAVGHALRRTAEDHLYWVLLSVRWIDGPTWNEHYREAIAKAVPYPISLFLPGLLRKGVRKSLQAHGLGRHDPEFVAEQAHRDLDAIDALLGDGPFLFGDRPTSYDCAVYAPVEHLLRTPGAHPLPEAARARETLVAWCERMNTAIAWLE